jgi:hypothetical protein
MLNLFKLTAIIGAVGRRFLLPFRWQSRFLGPILRAVQ